MLLLRPLNGRPSTPMRAASSTAPQQRRITWNSWVNPCSTMHARAHVICSASKRSLYEVLGVPQGASERDIKSAYRKRALKLHPDVNKAPDAQQQFMEAKMAFETLGDSKQRAEYDRRLNMGFGSSAEWQSRNTSSSSSSSSYGSGYGARRPASKPEDNYSFEDLMRDLDKEFSSWAASSKASSSDKQPKSLIEELGMLGEELVDFLEDAIGGKEDPKGGSSSGTGSTSSQQKASSSSSSGKARNAMDEFDAIWKQYGETFVNGATGASSSGNTTSSSGKTSSSGSNTSSTGRASGGSTGTGSSAAGAGRPGAAPSSKEDDIDAMLAELKKKVKKG